MSLKLNNQEQRKLLDLLRRLSRPGSRLLADPQTGQCELRRADGELTPRRQGSAFAQEFIRIVESRGMLERAGGELCIAPAGAAWLRRRLASDDPFLSQHRDLKRRAVDSGKGRSATVTINDAESPIAWLRRHKGADCGFCRWRTGFLVEGGRDYG